MPKGEHAKPEDAGGEDPRDPNPIGEETRRETPRRETTRREHASGETRRADGGGREAGAGLRRDFLRGEEKIGVVVEFGNRLAPASRMPLPPDPERIKQLQAIAGAAPKPVFTAQPVRSREGLQPASLLGAAEPLLNKHYEVLVPSVKEAIELSREIVSKMSDSVTEAVPVPVAVPAIGPSRPDPQPIPPPTPDMRSMQAYLGPGPAGINAYFVWQFPGGDGMGVTVIDLEGGWRLSHENLAGVRFNHWGGQINESAAWLEHGTAVAGMLAGPRDSMGVTGVCPGARVGMLSAFDTNAPAEQRVANQIVKALEFLGPGDVLLLELQRPGPAVQYQSSDDQKGYISTSFWPDVRTAITRAVARGICVIEVAGNGGEDLDNQVYEGKFDRARMDSGAIMVGAGAPPSGAFGAPRSRQDFSNYGRRVDCQGWGEQVTTSGFGDLWIGANDPNRAYTSRFMGTSSAAPMVAGLVACLQGRHKLVYGVPIPPLAVRYALNYTGWPGVATPNAAAPQNIGNLPDLAMLFQFFGLFG